METSRESLPSPLVPPKAGNTCPCGSGLRFDACCGPILSGARLATTAEELMRSRFTAHVANDHRHLHRTFLPTARLPYVAAPGESTAPWTRLEVHRHELDQARDTAWVDFSAYYFEDGAELALHERSEFKRVQGEWLYARAVQSGSNVSQADRRKAGRNDPCPCGSGRKFKHCCLGRP